MTHPSPARRLGMAVPALLFSLVVAAAILLTGPAVAGAASVEGQASFTLGSGKSGKALKKQNVRLTRVAPANVKNLSGKRFRVVLPARSVAVKPVKVGLKGGFALKKGKRSVAASGLAVAVRGRTVQVTAKLGGKKLTLLKGSGKSSPTTGGATGVKVNANSLKLTKPAAKTIKRKLKLRKAVPASTWGKLALNASEKATGPTEMDPYFAECGFSATAKTPGKLPPAAALPNMAGATPLANAPDIEWGFMTRFRDYITTWAGISGQGGMTALDGAGRSGSAPNAGFTFQVKNGSYKANDPADTSDDQAVINGKGTVVFCNPTHKFRIALSNPTVVIDGANSRVVADIDLNYFGLWIPAQRVDLGEIDSTESSPFYNRSGTEITWTDLPATLSAVGAESLCVPENDMGFPAQCLYEEGEPLDPVTVAATTDPTNAAAFPLPTVCDWTTSTNTKRIDPGWPAVTANPVAGDPIEGATTTVASLDWGVRQGLRGVGGPAGNTEVKVNGSVTMSNPGDMVGPGKFFTWGGSDGRFDAGEDRLVQKFSGSAGMCNVTHGFGAVISDPTVVIDGDDSRLSADVATRVGDDGDWIRTRVDLVRFKESEATPTETPVSGGTEFAWILPDGVKDTSGVLLDAGGATMLGPLNLAPQNPTYAPGAAFQGLTVRVTVPAE